MESKLRELYGQLQQLDWFCELTDLQKRDVLVRQYIEILRQTYKSIQIVDNNGEEMSVTDERVINGLSPVNQILLDATINACDDINQAIDECEDIDSYICDYKDNNEHKEVVFEEKQTANLIKAEYSMNSSKKTLIGYRCQYPGCDFTQRQKSRVQTHVNLTHTGKPTFKCKYCESYFSDNHQRNKHKKTHQNSSCGESPVINFN